ncbi:hypothetical protein [Synechococcus phage DSL-LC02]|nr:hypothetical protein [Synechococcus phage DSL-LC02]
MRNIDSFDYMRAVVLGVVLGMSSLSLIYMIGVALDTQPQPQSETPKSKFEVVDKYKNCDLLRWSDNQLADYKYILYCPNK